MLGYAAKAKEAEDSVREVVFDYDDTPPSWRICSLSIYFASYTLLRTVIMLSLCSATLSFGCRHGESVSALDARWLIGGVLVFGFRGKICWSQMFQVDHEEATDDRIRFEPSRNCCTIF